ncbi:CLUMA_CG001951, isoform A [Clunio marinus]|uniref:CLUMA_CG001951, isoform A n=1 Tax=Clunio marinus TaxID=568069 RepID=A0A1J1HNW5_9DIPT|nr:CLUMA_CG001951, isoform A [Clunio marinus]
MMMTVPRTTKQTKLNITKKESSRSIKTTLVKHKVERKATSLEQQFMLISIYDSTQCDDDHNDDGKKF